MFPYIDVNELWNLSKQEGVEARARFQLELASLAGGGLQGQSALRKRHSHWRLAGELAIPTGELPFEKKNCPYKTCTTTGSCSLTPSCIHSAFLSSLLIPLCNAFFFSLPTTGFVCFVFLVSIFLTDNFKYFLCYIYVKLILIDILILFR